MASALAPAHKSGRHPLPTEVLRALPRNQPLWASQKDHHDRNNLQFISRTWLAAVCFGSLVCAGGALVTYFGFGVACRRRRISIRGRGRPAVSGQRVAPGRPLVARIDESIIELAVSDPRQQGRVASARVRAQQLARRRAPGAQLVRLQGELRLLLLLLLVVARRFWAGAGRVCVGWGGGGVDECWLVSGQSCRPGCGQVCRRPAIKAPKGGAHPLTNEKRARRLVGLSRAKTSTRQTLGRHLRLPARGRAS